jgi:hypothetical protein
MISTFPCWNTPTQQQVVPKSIPIAGSFSIFRTVKHQTIRNFSNDILIMNLTVKHSHPRQPFSKSDKENGRNIYCIHVPVRAPKTGQFPDSHIIVHKINTNRNSFIFLVPCTIWPHPKKLTFGATVQCTIEDMKNVVPSWYYEKLGHCLHQSL